MTLYLLQYNNYYNRTIKREDSLAAYLEYQIGNALVNVNFNPNDGVNTEQIINWHIGLEHPDYILVVNEYNEINSRWFVIDSTRTRGGQYKLLLRRDLVADFYEPIINAPVFIEKAKLRTTNNLIFNNEDMTYNQILDRKIPLMDETEVPWVVGYIPRDSFQEDTTIETTVYAAGAYATDITVNDITSWEYYQYRSDGGTAFKATTAALEFVLNYSVHERPPVSITGSSDRYTNLTANMNSGVYNVTDFETTTVLTYRKPSANILKVEQNNIAYTAITSPLFDDFREKSNWDNVIYPAIKRTVPTLNTQADTYRFVALNGKTIRDATTGHVYEIKISPSNTITGNIGTSTAAGQTLTANFQEKTNSLAWSSYAFDSTALGYSIPTYTMTLTQISTTARTTINNNRYHLEDAPYDMFCIPAGDITIQADGVPSITCQGSIAMALATAIGAQTGTGNIYDIQLLPYFPARYMLKDGNIDVRNFFYHRVFDTDGGSQISCIFWATKSSDNFIVEETINVPTDPIEFKASNECDVFRLVSPNGNGMFEFKPTKNNGVDYFEADFTYKPFDPFIHVKPNFKRLYGDNPAKDFRGLICGGDFSITQLSNAWANYQQQNVNLLNAFNRQVENLEVNNAVQRQKEIASAVFGTIGAGISGASTGALVGGVYGAVAGGVAGTSLSAAGGVLDIEMADKLRAEALDYTKDQFGFQLGNIQAIPTSLAKTGAQVYVNTLFPTLEYYTCSQEERNALKNKIKYNGMTVMIIDNISRYLWNEPTYIKGKLIRLEGTGEDYHIVNAISAELDKGVFI